MASFLIGKASSSLLKGRESYSENLLLELLFLIQGFIGLQFVLIAFYAAITVEVDDLFELDVEVDVIVVNEFLEPEDEPIERTLRFLELDYFFPQNARSKSAICLARRFDDA